MDFRTRSVFLIVVDIRAKSRQVYFSSAWVTFRTISGTVVGSILGTTPYLCGLLKSGASP